MTLVALALLAGAAWLPGRLVTRRLPLQDLAAYERAALTLTAGLGLVALLLSILAFAHRLHLATVLLALMSAGTLAVVARAPGVGAAAASPPSGLAPWARALGFVIVAAAALGALGSIAPITDDDALAYVVPIARRIAERGSLDVWPDQARSMWPQSQQVLLAYIIRTGGTRLGALTALEWILGLGVLSALARRLCDRREHVPVALALAIGCPVVAFQVASGKEDLLLVAACAGAVLCLSGTGTAAELAASGVFAGLAAGAKYSGAPIALAIVLASALHRQPIARWKSAAIVAGAALGAGGFWYVLNLWRYGNPVAPMWWGAAGTPLDASAARAWTSGFGRRGPFEILAAPIRIFIEPDRYAGRGNLFNPLVCAGLAALALPRLRRRSRVALLAVAVLYVAWYPTLQNARLLLPAAVLLAPAAADVLVPIVGRARAPALVGWTALAASVGLVGAVGVTRAGRYAADPPAFLERETQRYADVRWMNEHLDPARHRVGSRVKALGYLRVPSLVLDASYQIEIADAELSTEEGTLRACIRQGVTHLFGGAHDFDGILPRLRLVYENPASRLGGVRFFREPPTEHTAVFEIVR